MSEAITANARPRRSFLFVPGTGTDMFAKAIAARPDIVCVDLEDAVAPPDKDRARAATLALFAALPPAGEIELLVRVNALRERAGLADLGAILDSAAPPPGLMLPKVRSPEDVAIVDDLLTQAGLPTRLQVIVETNAALEAAHEIARASPRIDALLFGAIDMSAELRVEPSWDALLYARQRLVHAAAGAGIDLIDVPFLDLNDASGLEAAARAAAAIGMTGKGAIHPRQLEVITRCFTPDAETVARAERIVAAFEQADSGLVVLDGKLIEKPVLRSAYRILAIAARHAADA
ncbi:MAG: CoA ester lyase [Gammaproteobacteria bacterium]|nr:CoA ester lyase [Gammaproteobacteria bacterium]